eukprot:354736-Prorocentrum_minimum.AAC.1
MLMFPFADDGHVQKKLAIGVHVDGLMFAKTNRAKLRWKSVSIRNPQRFGVAHVRDRPQVGLVELMDSRTRCLEDAARCYG